MASTDGYTVDTHFGRAYDFYIYQYLVDEWIFVEKRIVKPVCQGGQHSIAAMEENVSQFSDCQYVVASKIGTGAMSALQQKNIQAEQILYARVYKIDGKWCLLDVPSESQ